MYRLYVLTDSSLGRGRSHEEIAELAYKGGADAVQLRDKDMGSREYYETAVRIKRLSKEYGRLFIVNDRVDVALATDADGVHVGQSDLPVRAIRRIVPDDFIIGVSAGSLKEAERAVRDGADYVALSPVFDTSSKDDAGGGHGLEMLRAMKDLMSRSDIPVIAIGGINTENVARVVNAGADGIAVISAVISQDDVVKAAREMRELIRNASH